MSGLAFKGCYSLNGRVLSSHFSIYDDSRQVSEVNTPKGSINMQNSIVCTGL